MFIPDRVTERRNALRQRPTQLLGRERPAHSAARPERGTVEAAHIPFGPLVAVGYRGRR